jgi:hypothetical protein
LLEAAMPSDRAIIFSDLIGKLDVLRVSCEKCGREGSYQLNGLIDRRGRDGKVIDWLDEVTAECPKKIARDMNDPCGAQCRDLARALYGRAIRHDVLLFVLVSLFLLVVTALVIKDAKLLSMEEKPLAMQDKAPLAKEAKADHGGPQADDSRGKRSLTPDCEKELRRTPDLLRFFANRIQTGEGIQSVVADMRQQEKKLLAVCD